MKTIDFEKGVMEVEEDGERLRIPFDGQPPNIDKAQRKQLAREQKQARKQAAEERADLVRKRQRVKEQMDKDLPLEKKVNLIIDYLDL